jgi:hypothetical protein
MKLTENPKMKQMVWSKTVMRTLDRDALHQGD